MHQIRFRLGELTAPDPLAGFKGPSCKGGEGKGRGLGGEGMGKQKKGTGREGERHQKNDIIPRGMEGKTFLLL